jgi:hypothetical protein
MNVDVFRRPGHHPGFNSFLKEFSSLRERVG